jgi:hypothetical protein
VTTPLVELIVRIALIYAAGFGLSRHYICRSSRAIEGNTGGVLWTS